MAEKEVDRRDSRRKMQIERPYHGTDRIINPESKSIRARVPAFCDLSATLPPATYPMLRAPMKTPITLPQTKTLLPKKGAMVSPAMISTHIRETPPINIVTGKVLSLRYVL